MSQWKLLRDKIDVLDDPELAEFVSLATGAANTSNFSSIGHSINEGPIARIVILFLDDNDNFVIGDRGSFSIQYIEFLFEIEASGLVPGSLAALDSIELGGGIGYRPIITLDMLHIHRGTIRLSSVVPPAGATKMRVLFKEV